MQEGYFFTMSFVYIYTWWNSLDNVSTSNARGTLRQNPLIDRYNPNQIRMVIIEIIAWYRIYLIQHISCSICKWTIGVIRFLTIYDFIDFPLFELWKSFSFHIIRMEDNTMCIYHLHSKMSTSSLLTLNWNYAQFIWNVWTL